MIPKDCKRLAEVDFPIAEVSKHAVREKGLPQGHPSRMHLWWARRPLAACRAILLSLLWPDPCDPTCPREFKKVARVTLPTLQGRIGSEDLDLRHALLKFISDFATWNLSTNPNYIEISRALVKAAHGDEPPLVVDPFAGGGSIPLEALRVGCDAFASDLNPVACLILKVMLEDIPRHGPQLAEELRRAGAEIKQQTERALSEFYPEDPDGAKPIAYLWARTIRCESPNCGAEIPLVRSFRLCRKASRRRALRFKVTRDRTEGPEVEFQLFEPHTDREIPSGTVTRSKARCIVCGSVVSPERVRAQLVAQRGGADVIFDKKGQRVGGARLLAVVSLKPGEQGRNYRVASNRDYNAIFKAQQRLKEILNKWDRDGRSGLCPVPDESLPPIGTLGFRVQRYGMTEWRDLFTVRQQLSLVTIARATQASGDTALALALGKLADLATSGCLWHTSNECPNQVLTTGRIRPFWDFAEGVPSSNSSGGFQVCLDKLIGAVLSASVGHVAGDTSLAAAQESPLGNGVAAVWFTDPPYYNAIAYADLSDFFFVWLKRALPNHPLLRDPFDASNKLTPKYLEIVEDETKKVDDRVKDRSFFESSMAQAFVEGRRVLNEDGIGSVVFAHKTTEGWEALLSGMTRGGWTITGSWPVATEMTTRLRARDSAALATSVHLICRPRADDAPVGDWSEVLRELPKRVGDWMERLQSEGVRGADLVFACIGPALEIFSRYSRVETAEGREVKLADYLEKVWEVVGRTALEQVLGTAEARARNGAAGALEEDARLTALFLWTLQSANGATERAADGEADDEDTGDEDDDEAASRVSSKGYSLVFDVVRRFAQPLGIALPKWDGRIIETKKGVVRLLPVAERSRQLFGEDGTHIVAARLEESRGKEALQLKLFGTTTEGNMPQGQRRARRRVPISDSLDDHPDATTLDRLHMAMLLQANGRTNALRMLLKAEQERGPDFLRLANALSALYPRTSEEKRLLDAMLLAVPR